MCFFLFIWRRFKNLCWGGSGQNFLFYFFSGSKKIGKGGNYKAGTEHVTSRPMKGLEKNCNRPRRQTNKPTWRLYDWIGPVGPIQWNNCFLSVDVPTFLLFYFSNYSFYRKSIKFLKKTKFKWKSLGKSSTNILALQQVRTWLAKYVQLYMWDQIFKWDILNVYVVFFQVGCYLLWLLKIIEGIASCSINLINIKELQWCGFCSPTVHPARPHWSTVSLSPAPL